MNNPGSTVYVHWYGKLLQGTVINDHDLMGMVAVRIPLQGGHPVALFTPGHVYESETAANGIQAGEPHKKMAEDRTATSCKDSKPVYSTKDNPSEAWQAIQNFKQEHWDDEHNRLRIDSLEEFYQLWRAAVAAKYGFPLAPTALSGSPAESPFVAVDPGSPDGDHSAKTIVDTETGEIVEYAAVLQQPEPQPAPIEHHPIITEERYQELKEKMKVKLTKKQLRSTGRIQYTDSIQTSIFD